MALAKSPLLNKLKINPQVTQLQTKLSAGGLNPQQTQRIQNRLSFLGAKPQTQAPAANTAIDPAYQAYGDRLKAENPGTVGTVSPTGAGASPAVTPAPTVTPPATTQPTQSLADLQGRRTYLKNEIMRRRKMGGTPTNFINQFNDISKQINGMRNTVSIPGGENSTPGPDLSGGAGGTPGGENPQIPAGEQPKDTMGNAYFPDPNKIAASDYEGTPYYQFQKDQGSKALERLMAARGFTGSGKEIQANSNFLNELGAQESDKWWDRSNATADRAERMQQNESQRLTGREDAQWGRIMDILRMQMDQNPMQYAMQGTGQFASTGQRRGESRAAYRRDKYGRVVPRTSGGGGGPEPVFQPPFPSSPDYSMADMIEQANKGYSGNNWLSTIGSVLGSIF